ncbi:MAG TPA: hypothetical protein VM120_13325 [Bryobacteraceae bacterium]|nr:hypothetical protein [Bryobacteraceae bacterium]
MGGYLWDKSGPPDPEVARLEQLLGQFHHSANEPDWSAPPGFVQKYRMPLAVAAMLLVAIGVDAWLRNGWKVERLAGSPKISGGAVAQSGLLRVGQVLETDAASRAELTVGEIGFVQVEPGTRLRLLHARDKEQRMSIERGRIVARIFAPPRRFFVNMPAATAVDLGCAYELEVDPNGNGRIHVTLGWVGFESNGLESLIPAGAACVTRRVQGTGTPYFLDASEKLIQAVESFDTTGVGLTAILREVRPRDSLTLWHLLARTKGPERAAVFDQFVKLVPPPPTVTREGILRLDRGMLEAWWDQLGLGATNFWKLWKSTNYMR